MEKEELEKTLNEIYSEFEGKKPPFELNKYDIQYNEGFYKGRLNAMEIVVQRLTGKSGDELEVN